MKVHSCQNPNYLWNSPWRVAKQWFPFCMTEDKSSLQNGTKQTLGHLFFSDKSYVDCRKHIDEKSYPWVKDTVRFPRGAGGGGGCPAVHYVAWSLSDVISVSSGWLPRSTSCVNTEQKRKRRSCMVRRKTCAWAAATVHNTAYTESFLKLTKWSTADELLYRCINCAVLYQPDSNTRDRSSHHQVSYIFGDRFATCQRQTASPPPPSPQSQIYSSILPWCLGSLKVDIQSTLSPPHTRGGRGLSLILLPLWLCIRLRRSAWPLKRKFSCITAREELLFFLKLL